MTGKGVSTVKELSLRVDKLADEFQKGLQEFKKEFLSAKSVESSSASLTDSDFMVKFNKFEKFINDSICNLRSDVQEMKNDVSNLSRKQSNYELHRNSNFIIIHGLKNDNEDIYKSVLNLFSKMGNPMNKNDLNHCFRLKSKKHTKTDKPRPIVVQFCCHWNRNLVFYNKKQLKGSSVLITEMLTNTNLVIYKRARELFGKSAWSSGGKVYVQSDGHKNEIKCLEDLAELQK